jgi:hypothetical protein
LNLFWHTDNIPKKVIPVPFFVIITFWQTIANVWYKLHIWHSDHSLSINHIKWLRIFLQTWLNIVLKKKKSTLCKHRFPCNTQTHPINEDLLNIKRKGDPEVSYPILWVCSSNFTNAPSWEKELGTIAHSIELSFLYWSYRSLRNLKS